MAYFHTRRTLASSLIRALSSSSSPSFSSSSSSSSSSIASRSRFAFAILTKQTPLVPHSLKFSIRFQTSGSDDSPKDESSKTNPSKGPSKDTVILAGCDLQHWLIIMEFPKDKKTSEEEMVNTYVKTLAQVVGSEEEAKKKIYSVSTVKYTGFGAEISEELSTKVKGLPGVLWVLPDSYMDVPNKDYGGDLFVDGKVIPRPKYRYSQSQPADNKPGQKNDRRRETFQKESGIPTRKPSRTRGQRE